MNPIIEAVKRMFPAPVRAWLYGIGLASVPLAVWQGWIEPEAGALAGPLLLALLNVPKKNPDDHG